jgi:hypothetical protein
LAASSSCLATANSGITAIAACRMRTCQRDGPYSSVRSGDLVRRRDHQHPAVGALRPIGDNATVARYPRRVAVRRGRIYPGRLFLDTVGTTSPPTTATVAGQLRRGRDQRDHLAQCPPCTRLHRQTSQKQPQVRMIIQPSRLEIGPPNSAIGSGSRERRSPTTSLRRRFGRGGPVIRAVAGTSGTPHLR